MKIDNHTLNSAAHHINPRAIKEDHGGLCGVLEREIPTFYSHLRVWGGTGLSSRAGQSSQLL